MDNTTMGNSNSVKKGRPMIVFGEDWGRHPSSTQHLVNVLKLQRDIIWVNSIGLRKPRITWRDIKRVFSKVNSFFQKSSSKPLNRSKGAHQFIVIDPLVMPCTNNALLLWVNRMLLKRQISKALMHINRANLLVWTSLPTAVDYIGLLGDSAHVYYCGDDFSALEGVDHKFVTTKEKKLVALTKHVLTASKQLATKFPFAKTATISHGVDTALFSQKFADWPYDLPKGKPIAGFYGSISAWLDQNIILESAQALPQWNFVLVGNIECDVSRLKALDNVYFIEAKAHQLLPNYIKNWQVAMLPFFDNKQIEMCNPLKLKEYLASGVSIASTNFNALDGYRHLVKVVKNSEPFYQTILRANICNRKADIAARQQSVANASWEQRVEDIENIINLY
ncbi:glycosyltransferase family 1 protein [Thalassotalea sp. M1531]|uniref:Glycosyltransferase family 1 protein n=1 Tax=Thalassotalea algicola TaxID=2716224 RepID=A0A7Y0LCX4_9GAMM|nr:glycosyltransferase family 1 protein [Thalassotalea algicola]NMP32111.1 glycosyltransferase family 1 protein [Thalassotalea algicola]